MKYLIDSLQSYESGHGDALCPIRREADHRFMGDHVLLQPATVEEVRMLGMSIVNTVKGISISGNSPSFNLSNLSSCGLSGSPCINSQLPIRSEAQAQVTRGQTAPYPPNQSSPQTSNSSGPAAVERLAARAKARALPIPGVSIPDLGRKRGAWKRAIQQWEVGDEAQGLAPLKSWPEAHYTGVMRDVTGSKRSQRKLVAEEYER